MLAQAIVLELGKLEESTKPLTLLTYFLIIQKNSYCTNSGEGAEKTCDLSLLYNRGKWVLHPSS